jgi:hypothetical protein
MVSFSAKRRSFGRNDRSMYYLSQHGTCAVLCLLSHTHTLIHCIFLLSFADSATYVDALVVPLAIMS